MNLAIVQYSDYIFVIQQCFRIFVVISGYVFVLISGRVGEIESAWEAGCYIAPVSHGPSRAGLLEDTVTHCHLFA